MKYRYAVLLIFALSSVPAFAIDGQTLINQSIVTAAGGFPFTISNPGSYKLSGNLVAPNSFGSAGIVIAANNVTLDLNGFAISCASPGCSIGVSVFGFQNVSIQNGTLTNFGAALDLANSVVRVDGISASGGFNGIAVDGGSVSITKFTATGNANSGVLALGANTVVSLRNSIISGSPSGVQLGGAEPNFFGKASILGNTIVNNNIGLLSTGGQTAIGLNDLNNTTNLSVSVPGTVTSMNNNVCGTATC